jgi:hypothetical protein
VEEPLEPEEPGDVEEPDEPLGLCEPEEPVLPEPEPPDITSMRCTCEPEKLARTWSPSLMSERDARCPSFMICVLSSTLSCSESCFFD